MKTTRQKLKKIPNIPGLYRHVSGKYYMIRKIRGKIVIQCLETNDQATAKRILEGRTQSLTLKADSPQVAEMPTPVEMPTLQSLCDLYLKTKAGKTKGMVKNYRWVVGRLERDFSKFTWPIDRIFPSDLSVYFVRLSSAMGPRSFNHITEIVSQIFQLAVSDGYLEKNPVLLIPKKDRRRRIEREQNLMATIPTIEEFKQIVDSIRSQQHSDTRESSADFVAFCGLFGVGEAEVCSVNWENVDWARSRINFVRQKTGKSFYAPFYPWCREFIVDLWERSGKPEMGRIFSIRSAKRALYSACRRLGLTVFSPRDLRKMAIVRQIRGGLDVKMVSRFQGHSDGGKLILDTYTSQFDSNQDEYERKMVESLKG
jgi:integrase